MSTYYSNHYSPAIGATGHFTTLRSPMTPIAVGLDHSRVRHISAQLVVPSGTDMDSGDIIRLFDISSNARILELPFSMDANWGATTTFHIGVYAKGSNNDGAVIDVDLFASTVDWSGAIARTDYFTESSTLDNWDRGKALWELVNIGLGASTYSASTSALWTVAATTTQDISAAAADVEFLAECFYVAND